jgi:hypothetical protein
MKNDLFGIFYKLPLVYKKMPTGYAFLGSGTLNLNRHFTKLNMLDQDPGIRTIDTTNAVVLEMDVRLFNYKLGLIKDTNNVDISNTNTKYSEAYDCFPTKNATTGEWEFPTDPLDAANTLTLKLTASDLSSNLVSTNQFISLGKFEEIYKQFEFRVNDYFNWSAGFSTLFAQGNNNYVFTTATGDVNGSKHLTNQGMYNLMKTTTPTTLPTDDNYTETMTAANGIETELKILDVNTGLRNAVDVNQFGNRTVNSSLVQATFSGTAAGTSITGITFTTGTALSAGQILSGTGITTGTYIVSVSGSSCVVSTAPTAGSLTAITASIPVYKRGSQNVDIVNSSGAVIGYKTSFGTWDGFIQGDCIYFPAGISCTVHLQLGELTTTPLNFVNQATVGAALDTATPSGVSVNVSLPTVFTSASNLITYNVTAPLLIRLVDVIDTAPAITPITGRENLIQASGWGTLAAGTTYSLADKSIF